MVPDQPPIYRITPSHIAPRSVGAMLGLLRPAAEDLLQLRLPTWPSNDTRELADGVNRTRLSAGCGAVLINGDIDGARASRTGFGVHLKSAQLIALRARPLPLTQPVSASCHDRAQLDRAIDLGLDFVTLSPVAPTRSHPKAAPMGWARFHELVRSCSLPVYALGGVAPSDVHNATAHGAHGVAGIQPFWSTDHWSRPGH